MIILDALRSILTRSEIQRIVRIENVGVCTSRRGCDQTLSDLFSLILAPKLANWYKLSLLIDCEESKALR
jgi:hypothetical protein